jgi:hypothetical protein
MVFRARARCRRTRCPYFLGLIVCLGVVVERSAGGDLIASGPSAEYPRSSSIIMWKELIEPFCSTSSEETLKRVTPDAEKRRVLNLRNWFQRVDTQDKSEPRELLPHPLRTNLWELNCQWRGPARRSNAGVYRHSKLVLDFDATGYVRVKTSDNFSRNDDGDWIAMGKWTLKSSGVDFVLPFPVEGGSQTDRGETAPILHYFETDFHLNPFGPQPKFTRGVVFAENGSQWLRPVVATFTAKGIGNDTADFSYQKRKLPQKQ